VNEPRRLYRSADDRLISGVAAGLADYLNVDPILVRILWAISVPLTGFLTAFAYLVMMIVVPLEGPEWPAGAGFAPGTTPPYPGAAAPAPDASAAPSTSGSPSTSGAPAQQAPGPGPSYAWEAHWHRRAHRGGNVGGVAFGALLIVVGGLFAWHEIDPHINLGLAWELAIIVVGVVLVASSVGFRRGE
jgi:phage shock protein C